MFANITKSVQEMPATMAESYGAVFFVGLVCVVCYVAYDEITKRLYR